MAEAIATIKIFYEELGDDDPVLEATFGAYTPEGRDGAVGAIVALLSGVADRTLVQDTDTKEVLYDSTVARDEVVH